jgi:hypothetical protein
MSSTEKDTATLRYDKKGNIALYLPLQQKRAEMELTKNGNP